MDLPVKSGRRGEGSSTERWANPTGVWLDTRKYPYFIAKVTHRTSDFLRFPIRVTIFSCFQRLTVQWGTIPLPFEPYLPCFAFKMPVFIILPSVRAAVEALDSKLRGVLNNSEQQ